MSLRSSSASTRAIVCALLLTLVSGVLGANSDAWRPRSVYQIITDRFARTDGSTSSPCDPKQQKYCGGTWRGIINQLDYIQGMGFTAIWISPVVKNFNQTTKYGEAYHGFWPTNIYELNDNFGSPNDLRALADELHKRDMYLMVDVVANDYAYPGPGANVDYSTFVPLNDKKYFHNFCWIKDYSDPVDAEECWLGDDTVALADLNTEDPHVQQVFNEWVGDLIGNYTIDGLRIDAAKHVNKPFWQSFSAAAGVFTIGEVFDANATYACGYMVDSLSSVLNFPTYQPLLDSFKDPANSVVWPAFHVSTNVTDNCTDATVLGTFSENHDVARFASYTKDLNLAKNMITFTMLSDGIPMIYNGQEQHFDGASDPGNREALWLSGYNTNAPLYQHIKLLNKVRNQYISLVNAHSEYTEYWKYKAKAIYAEDKIMAVRKGVDNFQVVSVLNNYGVTDKDHGPIKLGDTSYVEGEPLVDVLSCNTVRVQQFGFFNTTISKGAPQVWMAAANLVGTDICPDVIKSLNPKCTGAHCTANSEASRPAAIGGSFLALFLAVLVLSSL